MRFRTDTRHARTDVQGNHVAQGTMHRNSRLQPRMHDKTEMSAKLRQVFSHSESRIDLQQFKEARAGSGMLT